MTAELDPHFFRHEYGHLVAILSRRFGLQYLQAVEDAVQAALLTACQSWPKSAIPDNPSAWLYRVAYNELSGTLRQQARRNELLAHDELTGTTPAHAAPVAFLSGEVHDDLLRMLFVCCDDTIPAESQLVFALKTLCGFDVGEIAERLFTTEANVYKRLGRARAQLRELPLDFCDLTTEQQAVRLSAVRSVLYSMFTEGYLSSHADNAIRRELCEEACRLTTLLAEHRTGATPETFALLALMYLHGARIDARLNGSGLVLLEEQDRALWNRAAIEAGLAWLARSAEGDVFSRYHAEAGIAAEHCLAPSLAETRWDRIVESYVWLERLASSPLHKLNRALAMAEWQGPSQGLSVLEEFEPPAWLAGTYHFAAVLADLHRRCGHIELAQHYRDTALRAAPSEAIRAALQRRLSHLT